MKLYKFFPSGLHLQRGLNALKNNKVWMSKPENFNDIYDCNLITTEPIIGFSEDKMKKAAQILYGDLIDCSRAAILNQDLIDYSRAAILNQDLIDSVLGWAASNNHTANLTSDQRLPFVKFFEERIKNIGVTCFSELYDHPLMWAHYAENHKGFCVEYDFTPMDTSSPDDKISASNFFVHAVSYVSKLPRIYSHEILFTPREAAKKMLATKSYHWAYEQEYRLIAFDQPVPPTEAGILYQYPSTIKPQAIILGVNVLPKTRKAVQAVCAEMNWEVKEMHIGKTGRFELKPTADARV
jgi:hypothetical protein